MVDDLGDIIYTDTMNLFNNPKYKVDYYIESDHRMYTDDLKYSEHLEIVFNNDKQCFVIKDIHKFRRSWRRSHPDEVIEEGFMKNFMEVKIK